ncbi:hypothetical protein [Bathymodiolus thermophilus thioautotrophic gill symbiont]|uniref:hypothetical protein n=1 Tax=Bathymodiolus thermophilus thioautotrophic gill symbiont TaxID=2360 RepID=UPI0013E0922C
MFTHEDWEEIDLLTGFSGLIKGHEQLLRSLFWEDEDYSGNVLNVLSGIASQNEATLNVCPRSHAQRGNESIIMCV